MVPARIDAPKSPSHIAWVAASHRARSSAAKDPRQADTVHGTIPGAAQRRAEFERHDWAVVAPGSRSRLQSVHHWRVSASHGRRHHAPSVSNYGCLAAANRATAGNARGVGVSKIPAGSMGLRVFAHCVEAIADDDQLASRSARSTCRARRAALRAGQPRDPLMAHRVLARPDGSRRTAATRRGPTAKCGRRRRPPERWSS